MKQTKSYLVLEDQLISTKSLPIFKMPSSFVVLGLIVVISAVNGAKSSLINASKHPTPLCQCNCNCNLNHDSHAMKALEAKLDHLVAVINKTSTPQPIIASGKL